MQTQKMKSVQSEHGPPLLHGEGQHGGVLNRLIRPSRFLHGQDIMAQRAQPEHDREGEILIRVEPGHDHADSFRVICASISAR